MTFPVFIDTCALYGAIVNDLLLRLAEARAYRPLWSADVLEELRRNLDRIGAAERVTQMRRAFPDAEVTGYRDLIPTMTCDPKDRHVLAAVIRAGAAVLVTFNIRDFPADSVAAYDLEVRHPDDFLLDQLDLYPDAVLGALEGLTDDYEHPPMTVDDVLDGLAKTVPRFAAAARFAF